LFHKLDVLNKPYNEAFSQGRPKENLDKESKAFLEKNKTAHDVKVTSSGLKYKIFRQEMDLYLQERIELVYILQQD